MDAEGSKYLAYSIIDFLNSSIKKDIIKGDNVESIEVAIECISDAFNIDYQKDAQRYSISPMTLYDLFKVFAEKKQLMQKEALEEKKKKAEEHKTLGNDKLNAKNYKEAIKHYSDAIAVDSSNAVYYCNRAAAYSLLNEHESAIEDSMESIRLDPNYGKAYSRLGFAYLGLNDFEKAVEAYKKALELDPNNANIQTSLRNAEEKLKAKKNESAPEISNSSPSTAPPNIANLLNNPNLMNMASQMLQSNPALANMAAGMMANQGNGSAPNPMDMLNNPELMNSLMNNPALMNLAQSFMQPPPNGNGN